MGHNAAVDIVVAVDDPGAEDVGALLAAHLRFSRGTTPTEFSFAFEADRLSEPDVTFFGARIGGRLVGVAALKRLTADHAELKSMHTLADRRRQGVGRALVDHLLEYARQHGYRRVSLETGTTPEFAPAHGLYVRAGFIPCPPFGDYAPSPYNTFMTISLEG